MKYFQLNVTMYLDILRFEILFTLLGMCQTDALTRYACLQMGMCLYLHDNSDTLTVETRKLRHREADAQGHLAMKPHRQGLS